MTPVRPSGSTFPVAGCDCLLFAMTSEASASLVVAKRRPGGQRNRHRHLLQQLQQHKVAGSEASRRAAEPPRTRATQHPASGSQLRVRKTLPRLARVTRRSGAAAQPPETATTASIRARDLAANSRGFLNQPNATGGRKNRGSGLVRQKSKSARPMQTAVSTRRRVTLLRHSSCS